MNSFGNFGRSIICWSLLVDLFIHIGESYKGLKTPKTNKIIYKILHLKIKFKVFMLILNEGFLVVVPFPRHDAFVPLESFVIIDVAEKVRLAARAQVWMKSQELVDRPGAAFHHAHDDKTRQDILVFVSVDEMVERIIFVLVPDRHLAPQLFCRVADWWIVPLHHRVHILILSTD